MSLTYYQRDVDCRSSVEILQAPIRMRGSALSSRVLSPTPDSGGAATSDDESLDPNEYGGSFINDKTSVDSDGNSASAGEEDGVFDDVGEDVNEESVEWQHDDGVALQLVAEQESMEWAAAFSGDEGGEDAVMSDVMFEDDEELSSHDE